KNGGTADETSGLFASTPEFLHVRHCSRNWSMVHEQSYQPWLPYWCGFQPSRSFFANIFSDGQCGHWILCDVCFDCRSCWSSLCYLRCQSSPVLDYSEFSGSCLCRHDCLVSYSFSHGRTMEAFLIILSATQLLYIAAIHGVRN
ncbi:hypothetical protein HID58_048741, partial [Brassica napus]